MATPRPVVEAIHRLDAFNKDRDRILTEVRRRVVQEHLHGARNGQALEYVLNEVAFAEMKRLENPRHRGEQKQLDRWRDLAHRLGRLDDDEARGELDRLVEHYTRDIVGNFNPRVYRFANDVLPPALGFLFTPISSWRDGLGALWELGGRVRVEGPIDTIRNLAERGTLVVTPTHSSNMDSVVVGFGLSRSDLPACTYGAGKNLFTNPLISFFMRNLGAYRVDRRLRFSLYKSVLKEYSTVLLEHGYHSLFFPGGTRSRSNMVEEHLKLGLLGTAITAYENNVAAGKPYRRIYTVPVTINYRLVLEAETLIDDYLAEAGKSRYIIDDDESTRVGRVVEFLRKTLALEAAVILRFGMPRDPFGNPVDEDGESLDPRGRRIDPAGYLVGAADAVRHDEQRDQEYTRILGEALAADFQRLTVFMSTHVVSRAIFDLLADHLGTRDIYRLLRYTPDQLTVDRARLRAAVDHLRQRIDAQPEHGVLDARVARDPADVVIADALAALGSYHTRAVAVRVGEQVRVDSMKLLYYYQNRTAHIPADRVA